VTRDLKAMWTPDRTPVSRACGSFAVPSFHG